MYSLILGINLGHQGYAKRCNDDSLFQKFRRDIQIEQDGHNGRVVWDDETKETYYLLMSACPIEALVKYTDDLNPAVRSKIFVGLAQKGADEGLLQEILDRHSRDTVEFISSPTDVVMTWTVKNYMQAVLDAKKGNNLAQIDYDAQISQIRRTPRVIISGASHGIISKDSLLQVDSLVYSEKGVRITSFQITVGSTTITTNNIFTERIRKLIRELEPGERVFIEELRVEFPGKTRKRLNDIILRVQ